MYECLLGMQPCASVQIQLSSLALGSKYIFYLPLGQSEIISIMKMTNYKQILIIWTDGLLCKNKVA